MIPTRTYNPEYLKRKNGFVREGIYENRGCFDKCEKKGFCEAGIRGICDRETYCTPINDEYNASEETGKQYCDPPLQDIGREPEFLYHDRESVITRLQAKGLEMTQIAFNPKKVESLRSLTTPEEDYKLFESIDFNGLQIVYIGSNSSKEGIRDVIIVKFEAPYMIDIGGRVKKTQVFYRSTGRNSGVKNSWFPFNGIVSPGIWFDKGGKLPGPKKDNIRTLSTHRPNWKIKSPFDGGDSPLFHNYGKDVNENFGGGQYKNKNQKWEDLKNIVGRFSYDKFMEISLILGGGQLWEKDPDGVSLRNSYFKTKNLVKKTYDIPSTRIKLSDVQINSIIGPYTEYGININKDFFKFQNYIEPYSEIIKTISLIGWRDNIKEECKEHGYNFKVVTRLHALMNSLEQKYKYRGNDENKASFLHGAGNTFNDVKRQKYDKGLPSGNILWMYAITTNKERKYLIELLKKVLETHFLPEYGSNRLFEPELNMDYIKGEYTSYTNNGKTIDLAEEDPGILGVKTWEEINIPPILGETQVVKFKRQINKPSETKSGGRKNKTRRWKKRRRKSRKKTKKTKKTKKN